jgi:limonene-1,2-epoxide hydrolase
MAVDLESSVAAQVDGGAIKVIPLVRFDLPGKTVGYHTGGRPFTYGGLEYFPNRFLSGDGLSGALGNQITDITLQFSGVPTDNADDAIASIEEYDYLNAPVTISFLAGDPETDEVLGVLVTQFYEVNEVDFDTSAIGADGQATISLTVNLETLARRYRDQTYAKRSEADQVRHNSTTDTALRYVATSPEWVEEWGQR